MIAAGIAAAVLVVFLLIVLTVGLLSGDCAECEIEREQARAEAAIDEEHRAARRAMNDAAGQSWRNLSE